MMLKLVGGLLILISCGIFGFLAAGSYYLERLSLRYWISALDYMQCELQYRLTPLPDLCRQAAALCSGNVKQLFHHLAEELEQNIEPDVSACMKLALARGKEIPAVIREEALHLGTTLGRFDSEEQIQQLETARQNGRRQLDKLELDADQRIRSCQTLGLCAGAALAILLI